MPRPAFTYSAAALRLAERLFALSTPESRSDREWVGDPEQVAAVREAALELVREREWDDHAAARALALAVINLDHELSLVAGQARDGLEGELPAAYIQDIAQMAVHDLEIARIAAAPAFAVGIIAGSMPAVSAPHVLGVSASTWRRWQTHPPQTANARLVTVAQCVYWIRHGFTAEGVAHWFDHERWQISERTPLTLIEEDAAGHRETLVSLAYGGLHQVAS